jgi:ribosomal protein S18 acetylase RimI-like enzyme
LTGESYRIDALEGIALAPASAADTDYLYHVAEATMRGYVEATWGEWHEDVARAAIVDDIAHGRMFIVSTDEALVGLMSVRDEPTHIHLDKLYIAPNFQRRGIGTHLLRDLIRRATADAKPLRLRVLAVNPAKRLYERLGFVVIDQTPERYFMEYTA